LIPFLLVSLWRCFVCLLLIIGIALPLRAEEAHLPLDQQTAAVSQVVLGILSFARWPQPVEVLQLCVVGPTEYADGLLQGAVQSDGLPVQARRLALDDPRLVSDCQALYLGVLSEAEHRGLFTRIAGQAVLSISEHDPECSVGTMFCLKTGGPRVGFAVNLDSVARSGVRVHPNVLKLGRRGSAPSSSGIPIVT